MKAVSCGLTERRWSSDKGGMRGLCECACVKEKIQVSDAPRMVLTGVVQGLWAARVSFNVR